MDKQQEMVNVIFVGGPFAGLKSRIPAGKKAVRLPLEAPKVVTDINAKPQKGKFVLYQVELCVISSPTMDDVTSFNIAMLPGQKMTDAFMEILGGYRIANVDPRVIMAEDEGGEDANDNGT